MSAALWRGIALTLAILLLVASVGIVYEHAKGDAEGFRRATSERAARDAVAIFTRVSDNAALSIKQDAINRIITKVKNEEVTPVIQRIYVDRVRVGTGTCGSTSATNTSGAGSGDGADTSVRLVREDIERDTRALIEAVERDLATGRACQMFLRESGMAQ